MIDKTLKRAQRVKLFYKSVVGVSRGLAAGVAGFACLLVLDVFFSLPVWFRMGASCLLALTVLLSLLTAFWPLRQFGRRTVALEIPLGGEKPDDLLVAWELERGTRAGTSEIMAQQFCHVVTQRLSSVSLIPVMRPENFRKNFFSLLAGISLVLGVFLMPSALLREEVDQFMSFEDHGAILRYIEIEPGSGRVPWGSPLEVRVRERTPDAGRIRVHARHQGRRDWQDMALWEKAARVSIFRLDAVREPIEYIVYWEQLRSPRYLIFPVPLPRLGDFEIRITRPPYTRAKEVIVSQSPAIQALAGSEVEVRAKSSAPLAAAHVVFSDGRLQEVERPAPDRIVARFVMLEDGEYWFDLQGVGIDIKDPQPTRYPVRATADEAPQVNILSPQEDLLVAWEDRVSLAYEFSDDFGVVKVDLVYQIGDRAPRRRRLKSFKNPQARGFHTERWSLVPLRLEGGEVVRYHLEAEDANDLSGPGVGRSQELIVEIASYENEHRAIGQELEAFRQKLLDALGEEILLQSKLQDTDIAWEEVMQVQNQVAENLENADQMLADLLPRMERDPLGDYGLWTEHGYMKKNLKNLQSGPLQQAQKSIQEQQVGTAQQATDAIVAELERMSLLSEDLQKGQRMSDLMSSGRSLEKTAESLAEAMQGAPSDPEKLREISALMEEAAEILSEIAHKLQDLSQELPEEFVNQDAVKSIDLKEMQQTSDSIQAALAAGDTERALEMAQQFLNQVQDMMEAMQAGSDAAAGQGGASSELASKLEEKTSELSKIIEKQKKLIAETQDLEKKRMKALLESQEKLLARLAAMQRVAIQNTESLLKRAHEKARFSEYHPRFAQHVQGVMPLMRQVLGELESKQVAKAPSWLELVIKGLQQAEQATHVSLTPLRSDTEPVAVSTTSLKLRDVPTVLREKISKILMVRSDVASVKDVEVEILEALRSPPQMEDWSETDRMQFESLQGEQGQLRSQTTQLRQEIQNLSRQTALVGTEIHENLRGAASDMGQAEGELGKGKSRPALESERAALQKLSQGEQGMQSALQAMAQMRGKSGRPMMGSIQPRSRGGGSMGTQVRPVHIPTPEEYRPPREFREEILESLKERYPEEHERLIKDYFKRLTE